MKIQHIRPENSNLLLYLNRVIGETTYTMLHKFHEVFHIGEINSHMSEKITKDMLLFENNNIDEVKFTRECKCGKYMGTRVSIFYNSQLKSFFTMNTCRIEDKISKIQIKDSKAIVWVLDKIFYNSHQTEIKSIKTILRKISLYLSLIEHTPYNNCQNKHLG